MKRIRKSIGCGRDLAEEDYVRTYPYNTLASDVIGFTVDGNVGSNGIEAAYNSILNGTDGREYGYLDDTSTVEQDRKEAGTAIP